MIVYPPSRHGVYTQPGGKGVAANQVFAAWSGAPVHTVLDFAEHTRDWPQMTRYLPFEEWARYRGLGMRLVLSVGLVPGDPKTTPYTLAEGAAGAYDEHFAALARKLVDHGLEDTIIRLGWEMNGGWYPWTAREGREAVYAGAFRHAVDAFRSVPGGAFLFDLCGANATTPQIDYAALWPGDGYVDIVGVDVYDTSWPFYPAPTDPELARQAHENAWLFQLGGDMQITPKVKASPVGLRFWADYARSHGVPLAIDEWGVTIQADGKGGGDNPRFIDGVFDFVEDPVNRVAYSTYFEIDVPGRLHALSRPDTRFPLSAARFLERVRARHAAEERALALGPTWLRGLTTSGLEAVADTIERQGA